MWQIPFGESARWLTREPIVGTPDQIAAIGDEDQPGIRDGLLRYFGSRPAVFAVPIVKDEIFDPIPLGRIREALPGFHPPQSYSFVDRNPALLAFLQQEARSALLAGARPR